MAKELKKRDNQSVGPFIEGTVVSASPLRISIYDGAAILPVEMLKRVDPWMQCTAYQSCALRNNLETPCNGCADGNCLEPKALTVGQKVLLIGKQVYYIVGVVTDA